jgi:hypothetical protein
MVEILSPHPRKSTHQQRLSTITDQDMSGVIHGGSASAAAFGTMTSAPDGSTSRDDGKTFATDKQLIDTSVFPGGKWSS